ncbi:hypothetical protein DL93DRAFT_2225871 [Clavulina sp. PMI_390]|nr:hypothetical protein DL93DRAFT_2225871 [Clavulina sp. PMI_390]
MDPQAFQRLHPRTYLERFLAEGLRPDGREPSSWRNVSVNAGSITTAEGSALVRIGDTTVVCGVKAEITEPDIMKPNDGYIVPNVDFGAICSPKFKPGAPGEESQAVSQRLMDVLTSTNLMPLQLLCIEPGKSAWVLYIDAICINYDGSAFDATLIAMVCALLNTRLPKATYNTDTQRTTVSRTEFIPLALNRSRIPYPFTFGTFTPSTSTSATSGTKTGPIMLADPSAFEEPLLQSTVNVCLLSSGAICSTTQVGPTADGLQGTVKQPVDIMSFIRAASERLPVLQKIIEDDSILPKLN